mmetsp:Transcript_46023/g.103513  ORF Transcript_46023/g.103513 Transcript_46023/m.103513 type:complete len:230 (-) Transcript_46023:1131-1820(-)
MEAPSLQAIRGLFYGDVHALQGVELVLDEAHEVAQLVQLALALEDHAEDVEALGLTAQPQAAVAELVDVHQLGVVAVEELEQSPRVARLDLQGLEVRLHLRAVEYLLHLVHCDKPRVVFVQGLEDVADVLHIRLLPLHLVLDEQISIVLLGLNCALHEDARDDVQHAEDRHSSEGEKSSPQDPVNAKERLDYDVPVYAASDGLKEAVHGHEQAPVARLQLLLVEYLSRS